MNKTLRTNRTCRYCKVDLDRRGVCPSCGSDFHIARRVLPYIGERPPPVGGRPCCLYCGKPMRPNVYTTWRMRVDEMTDPPSHNMVAVGREWDGTYGRWQRDDGWGFCSKDHGYNYGRAVADGRRELRIAR